MSSDGQMPSHLEGVDEMTESQMHQLMLEMHEQGLIPDSQMDSNQIENSQENSNQDYEQEQNDEEQEEYQDQNEDVVYEDSQYYNQSQSQNQNNQNLHQKTESDEYEADDDFLRKIKRDLLQHLNQERKYRSLNQLYIDLSMNLIAHEYSQFLLNNDHSIDFYENLKVRFMNDGETELCYITAKYEEDIEITQQYIQDYFTEIGYLFLECEDDKRVLMNPSNNHIGIGVSTDEIQIVIVFVVSEKALCIQKIYEPEPGRLEIRGKILQEDLGIYAIRIVNKDDPKKDIRGIGPEFIEYNRQSKEWIANFDIEYVIEDSRKALEFYTRITPDSIPYKKKQTKNEKISYKHLQLKLRTPYMIYPDPKYAAEEEQERIRKEQEQLAYEEEERKIKEEQDAKRLKASRVQYKDGEYPEDFDYQKEHDYLSQSDDSDKQKDSKNQDSEQLQTAQQAQDTISNKEIRQELEMAITEAQRQHDEFMEQNHKLQEEIKLLKNKNEGFDRSNETAMNEHKYLNTLAHVHQIRLDLKQTQERYNKMSLDLQQKLESKQKKCNEIKYAFMELKREVAKKAANSRNDKPIPEKLIDEWEQREHEKSKELQELRLQILRLRNAYVKNQKILKKKEELAEGLHLIDFEQLKIENQTLNEKIEERNEELHKLKKKNTTTIQILTHTREKLGFVQVENEDLNKLNVDKDGELNYQRGQLTECKRRKDSARKDYLILKQKTGIVNSKELGQDYRDLRQRVQDLEYKKEKLEAKLSSMHEVIKTAYQIQQQKSSNKMQR